MTRIFDFLLAFSVYYATFQVLKLTIKVKKLEYLFYTIAMFAFSGIFVSDYIDLFVTKLGYVFDEQLMREWCHVVAISSVLTGLAFLIYYSKPPFARFPIVLCFVPLLIIGTYVFSMHTLVLKEWLLSIYEGGALLIAVLMHAALIKKSYDRIISLIGILIILAAYLLYWFPLYIAETGDWIWKSFMIAGMFILVHGFNKIESPDDKNETQSNSVGFSTP